VRANRWARRHPDLVRGIAYLETLVAPVSWSGANAPDPDLFRPRRSAEGEQLVLVANVFVEKVLPAGTIRTLAVEEMDAYRAPYRAPGESRRPTLTWPREIPIDGEPADVAEIVSGNAAWMASSQVPKLFVNGEPGALLTGPLRERCRQWPNQREVTVPGLHFLPEDSGAAIAEALRVWLPTLPVNGQLLPAARVPADAHRAPDTGQVQCHAEQACGDQDRRGDHREADVEQLEQQGETEQDSGDDGGHGMFPSRKAAGAASMNAVPVLRWARR